MDFLITGLSLFIGIHLLPCFPALSDTLQEKLGPNTYKALFSIASLIGIGLMVYGLTQASVQTLYEPPSWGRHLAMLFMLPALYLFFSTSRGPWPSSAKVVTAHPMSWGVTLWAGAHLLANGDIAHVLLFASLLIYSLISIASGQLRGQKPVLSQRPPLRHELLFIGAVISVYALLMFSHRYFTGMPLI